MTIFCKYDLDTNSILLINLADGSEYEISYDCLKFSQYLTEESEESGDAEQIPSDDIDIDYETTAPLVTDMLQLYSHS